MYSILNEFQRKTDPFMLFYHSKVSLRFIWLQMTPKWPFFMPCSKALKSSSSSGLWHHFLGSCDKIMSHYLTSNACSSTNHIDPVHSAFKQPYIQVVSHQIANISCLSIPPPWVLNILDYYKALWDAGQYTNMIFILHLFILLTLDVAFYFSTIVFFFRF